ncbi:hypothetical protein RIE95_02740 [Acidithiobacillus thiooxidans]|uniref:Uncharacterized protein n=1 Tax=Acidithiobacillus thiooxidans ATCC 19377 TaxID=637390 RepID=A0A543PZ62_ACITH|nr:MULTISPECIES: hypothetical protein [Acidithiobacillus]MBU2836024.1 hypothetical protein [Acidithiobacillus thiooxidans]MDA8177102.1 hypothetical protein [Acidithiobacillus sp.]MDR7925918.1 hypothetical protein [Acidithiobacillus thiooxidans]MDX5936585.1 hypothetical protein [Acidithiobacillus thiooxidans]TQN49320.1 hypothetical protein DLNHIDIE_03368 [Acidithiobacillus thiooxidans ATCC 19377]
MNTAKDIAQARNPDLRASMAAMRRAAQLARQIAIQTNTGIVMVRDGQCVRISAQELREADAEAQKSSATADI